MEGRTKAEGKSTREEGRQTLSWKNVPAVVERISQRAKRKKGERFNNLLSHLKVPLLRQAYASLNKRASAGVDRVTWEEYGSGLDERLQDLEGRIQRGSYRPMPVRRVLIPKGDGRMRPLGIPTLEDKIVQQAVRWLLDAIYEEEFVGFSYGFRRGRSPHKALDALEQGITTKKIGYILDADIQAFFDSVEHTRLVALLGERISDRRLLSLIEKWLKAGVMTTEGFEETDAGTPQGGIISPLLANVYLHHVLDRFVQRWRREKAKGDVIVVRYADDFVIGCRFERDVVALKAGLTERLGANGLTLHPAKTRVIEFGRRMLRRRRKAGLGKLPTFDFLGFTHITVGKSYGRKRCGILRITSKKKRNAKLKALRIEMQRRRHESIAGQHRWLSAVMRGHIAYYALPGNRQVALFRYELTQAWAASLQRRSQRARWGRREWERFQTRWALPRPRPRRR